MGKYIAFFHFVLIVSGLFAQTDTSSFFQAPLDIPLSLSANFGELRPNHFHMGIDYRTNGKEGLSIHAVGDGYVSRIKVSPYGYGKVIYINHPNGITSVYAHCSSFLGKLDSVVKSTQYKLQNYEIELLPDSTLLPVKKGDIIALSGNTGSSSGPHLHFELRDTKTEIALNPFVYGFEMKDQLPPIITGIKIYALTKEAYRWPGKSKIINVLHTKSGYAVPNNIIQIPSDFCSEHGGIGFAIEACDHINDHTHDFSYFGAMLTVDNDTVFVQENDEISFEGTRFINTHQDIEEYKKSKRKFQKSFRNKTNYLESYSIDTTGVIAIKPNDTLNVEYTVYDTHNNQSKIAFKLNALNGKKNEKLFNITNCIIPESSFIYSDSIAKIQIPEACVYEPTPINYKQIGSGVNIGLNSILQDTFNISLRLQNSELPVEKYFIKVNGNNKYLETTYLDGWLHAQSKYLGTFSIDLDTTAPSIAPLNFNKLDTLIKKNLLTWKVNESKTQLKDYDLFIDGTWELLEYESKGGYVFFRKPKSLTGKHLFQLITRDACGNENIWEKELWVE